MAKSKPARELFSCLMSLVQCTSATDDILLSLGEAPVSPVDADGAKPAAQEIISIFTAVQALSRPLQEGETRAELKASARHDIIETGIPLPHPLMMLLAPAAAATR
jgi:hypothetical protein